MKFEELTPLKNQLPNESIISYRLSEIKSKYKIIHDLTNSHILAIHPDEDIDSSKVDFALFEFGGCVLGATDDEIFMTHVFHGYGFSEGLREMRHTYFGEEGYLFYVPMKSIIEAFGILMTYFDGD